MRTLTPLVLFILHMNAFAQLSAPGIEWQHTYGGSADDRLNDMKPTADGGYIMVGLTASQNGQVSNNYGVVDAWVVKVNANGILEWQKNYGGAEADNAHSIVLLDNGYVIAGATSSSDGDVNENYGGSDIWVFKIDLDGNMIWEKTYGGTGDEIAFDIIRGSSSGFYLIGETNSTDGMITEHHGGVDMWVIHIDEAGDLIWERSFGNSFTDVGRSITQFPNGDIAIAGNWYTASSANDVYVARLTSAGEDIWQEWYGGSSQDWFPKIQLSPIHEIHIAARTLSTDGDIQDNQGMHDLWHLRLNEEGVILSSNTYGGSSDDMAFDIAFTSDGGILICGQSASNDGDLTSNFGQADAWLLRLDAEGEILWQRAMGGSAFDHGIRVYNEDDAIILAGMTRSNDLDVSGNHGNYDYWLVKLQGDPVGILQQTARVDLSVYPNPSMESTAMNIRSDRHQLVQIELLDASGRITSSYGHRDIMIGSNIFEIDLNNHTSGHYHLVVKGEGVLVRTAIIKL